MEIIDVTLRESVYCNNPISMEVGLEMIRRLSLTGIDYIEIGYLKKNYVTRSFFMNYNPDYIKKAYSITGKKSKLSAMIHPQDFFSNDWDPDVIKKLIEKRIPCIYGDMEDPELLEKLQLNKVELVISTIPSRTGNEMIIKNIKKKNPDAIVIVTSTEINDALEFYDLGADYVIIPHFLGGEHMSIMLEDISKNFDKLINTKISHIRELKLRRELHPHHK